MQDWDAEGLRLTCFLAGAAKVAEPAWWSDLVGSPPESRTSRPALGELTESGPFEGANLRLSVAPGRVDWQLIPIEKQAQLDTEIPTIGSYFDTVERFTATMKKWLPSSPAILRLAFGAVLHRVVKDRKEGYQQFQPLLHYIKLDPESSDFLYQINRRRLSSSGIPNLNINRLSKWAVMSLGRVILLQGGELIHPQVQTTAIACRLELDINTQSDLKEELPKEKVNDVFDELVTMGIEIAKEGDIP